MKSFCLLVGANVQQMLYTVQMIWLSKLPQKHPVSMLSNSAVVRHSPASCGMCLAVELLRGHSADLAACLQLAEGQLG
jgi:hypothetical protein